MWHDKRLAINDRYRISENTLIFLAIMLGSLGIYGGMKAPIHHKSKKLKFRILVPLSMVLNVITLILLFKFN